MPFLNREDAGQKLAEELKNIKLKNPVVIALPRGGLPIAAKIAETLKAPLDVVMVRKIGAPGNPEYAIGAITEGNLYGLNPGAIEAVGMTQEELQETLSIENQEVHSRVQRYRKNQPLISLQGRDVILVDDGLATGLSAYISLMYLKRLGANQVILAVPVCARESASLLRSQADQVICLEEPEQFMAVGLWYQDFSQVSDTEVTQILSKFRPSNPGVSAEVVVTDGKIELPGHLTLPSNPKGVVIFAHGSGSSRHSTRNIQVAQALNQTGLGTLLFDLLTQNEAEDRANVFNIPLLAKRLVMAVGWTKSQSSARNLPKGFFGASTGGGAALWAAADLGSEISAIVSRGGRPDLAIVRLKEVKAPTLLIVGGYDKEVIKLNQLALPHIPHGRLVIVPRATHLFEEPGALEAVAKHAQEWFTHCFEQSRLEHRLPKIA